MQGFTRVTLSSQNIYECNLVCQNKYNVWSSCLVCFLCLTAPIKFVMKIDEIIVQKSRSSIFEEWRFAHNVYIYKEIITFIDSILDFQHNLDMFIFLFIRFGPMFRPIFWSGTGFFEANNESFCYDAMHMCRHTEGGWFSLVAPRDKFFFT